MFCDNAWTSEALHFVEFLFTVPVLKFHTVIPYKKGGKNQVFQTFFFGQNFGGIANCADPGQTAP